MARESTRKIWARASRHGCARMAAVIEALDLNEVTLVGHSTGGGKVIRYIERHATKASGCSCLIAAGPSIVVKAAANSEGSRIVEMLE